MRSTASAPCPRHGRPHHRRCRHQDAQRRPSHEVSRAPSEASGGRRAMGSRASTRSRGALELAHSQDAEGPRMARPRKPPSLAR
ncbi:hypothetical protein ACFPRL_28430 [Pseudoclavibacter helvolus]